MQFIHDNHIANTPFLSLNSAIFSGNLAMIDFIIEKQAGNFARNDEEIQLLLKAAASQRLKVYLYVKNRIEKKCNKKVVARDDVYIEAILSANIDTFEVAFCDYKNKVSIKLLEKLFEAAIESRNVIVINYIIEFAAKYNHQFQITENHLILAAKTNAEIYSKILQLAKARGLILQPNEVILSNACDTHSKLLVKRVLEHADEHNLLVHERKLILGDRAVTNGSVGILQLIADKLNSQNYNLPTVQQLILRNPFTYVILRETFEGKKEIEPRPH